MSEEMKLLIEYTRENERFYRALLNMRTKMVNYGKDHGRVLLAEDELNEVLEIAGLEKVNDPNAGEH